MNETIIGLSVLVIMGICQAIKYAGVNTRWIPIIAIVLGMGGAVYFGGVNWLSLAAGIIAGLSASGLYSGLYKAIILNK